MDFWDRLFGEKTVASVTAIAITEKCRFGDIRRTVGGVGSRQRCVLPDSRRRLIAVDCPLEFVDHLLSNRTRLVVGPFAVQYEAWPTQP